MSGNDKIVTAILTDASIYADQVKSKAVEQADKIVKEAEKEAEIYLQTSKKEAEKEGEIIVNNKRTLIRLDENKIKLGARRNALNKVYVTAVDLLENLDGKAYLSLIENLISKYAEKGEVALISKNAPVSVSDVTALNCVNEKGVIVKGGGEAEGGLILIGNGYEKSLTFTALIDGLRAETETEISTKLF